MRFLIAYSVKGVNGSISVSSKKRWEFLTSIVKFLKVSTFMVLLLNKKKLIRTLDQFLKKMTSESDKSDPL